MINKHMIDEILRISEEYCNLAEYRDIHMACCAYRGIDMDSALGIKDIPNWIRPVIEHIASNSDIAFSEATECTTEKLSLVLESLLCTEVLSLYEDNSCEVTENVYNIMASDLEEVGEDISDYELVRVGDLSPDNLVRLIIVNARGINTYNELSSAAETKESNSKKKDGKDLSKWDAQLKTTVNDLLNVLGRIYKGGYDLFKPRGVLTKSGLVGCGYDPFLDTAYQLIVKSITGRGEVSFFESESDSETISSEDFYDGATYYSDYHLRNAVGVAKSNSEFNKRFPDGVKNWTELRPYVEKEILLGFRSVIVKEGIELKAGASIVANKALRPYINAIRTCILVDEIDEHGAMKFKISLPDGFSISKQSIESTLKSGTVALGSSVYVDRCVKASGIDGVYYITVVYDKSAYESTPLFAFQILDALERNGVKPCWSNVILGRKLDDTVYSRSFAANTQGCTAMIASQRSGKGVLTLNIIASALGCGAVPFYLDCKPDMSLSLQDIAKEYGKEMFSFDGTTSILRNERGMILPEHEWGIKGQLWDIDSIPRAYRSSIFKTTEAKVGLSNAISYIRGIQLLSVLISKRAGQDFARYGGDRIVIVLDELEKYDRELSKLVRDMQRVMEQECSSLKKDEKLSNEVYKYYRDFTTWCCTVLSNFTSLFKAHLGLSRTSIFVIFQTCMPLLVQYVDGVKFGKDGLNLKEDRGLVFYYMAPVLRTDSARLLGNGTGKSGGGNDSYGCASSTIDESIRSVISQYGFIDTVDRGVSVSNETSVPFKPYFVLNDTKGACIDSLYDRCSLTREELDAIIKDDSKVPLKDGYREDIAFMGYAKRLLGKSEREIVDLLASGWDIAIKVLREIGFEDGLQYFMYDMHTFTDAQEEENIDDSFIQMTKEEESWVNGSDLDVSPMEYQDDEFSQDFNANTEQENGYDKDSDGYFDSISKNLNKNIEDMLNSDEYKTSYENTVLNKERENIDSSDNVFNIGGRKIKVQKYNDNIFESIGMSEQDFDFSNEITTTECLKNLSKVLYKTIDTLIGSDRVMSVIEKDRYLIVNNVLIAPSVSETIVRKLPYDIKSAVRSGRFADVFCFGVTIHFKNLSSLEFTDSRYFYFKALADYGVSRDIKSETQAVIRYIFSKHKNLHSLTIGSDTVTLDSLEESESTIKKRLSADRRSIELDENINDKYPSDSKWGISSFYRSSKIPKSAKIATTIGVGALAAFALSNPIGTLAVGYLGINETVKGAKRLTRRVKGGLSDAFGKLSEALKSSR